MARDEGNSGRNSEHRETHPAMSHQSLQQPVSGSMLTTGALIGVAALIALARPSCGDGCRRRHRHGIELVAGYRRRDAPPTGQDRDQSRLCRRDDGT